ncbi:restriction endonuclease subunit S [Enterobacter vonholyi]|uniref:restriction endonuclease subunit S n=1 Tax=Enterobacter TaxID=547 RepID=UPI0020BFF50F|nr:MULTISPECIES: restriction endonuclease subunit S [Enterobacter]MCL5635604.1 restriction endonuclease subunit S [Enterobacter vonholyi]MCQ4407786.1 restriction endonuclease subunit S [Enterobacter cloacae]HCT9392846.1 restriction endonuclease subunit S [Enterobacter hormaechei]HDC4357382.1 restriction endonuclease subunit S [Enterobacter cloacae]
MSGLSYLEKLLDGAEVEWRTLDSVGQFLRGKRFVKSDLISEGVPCIHYGEMYTHYGISAEETKSFLDEGVAEKLRVANHGDVIIVAAGETIEDIGNGTAWLGKNDVVFHDACFSFKSELNSKYVSYFLRTNLFKEQIKRGVSSGKISSINAKGLGMAEIPIPCPNNPEKSLAIQSEIVGVLDKFTALTAELTAELSMRKKQYNHYRDLLLSFEEGEVEWKTLGEMGTLIRGKRFVKTDIIPKGVPCIHYGEMYTHYSIWANRAKSYISVELASKLRKASCGDVVFVSAGETIADIGRGTAWLGDEDVVIHDACFFYKSSLNPKYVAYFSRTNFFHDQIKKSISSGKISAINAKGFEKVIIPVPSPEEQARIVAFLDKFDTLTSSITEGLPREIELRQKQYEYYRDLLFSFPKPETASN